MWRAPFQELGYQTEYTEVTTSICCSMLSQCGCTTTNSLTFLPPRLDHLDGLYPQTVNQETKNLKRNKQHLFIFVCFFGIGFLYIVALDILELIL